MIVLSLDGKGTLPERCYRELRDAVLSGRLAPGTRLPATRELAADLQVSRPVIVQAYQQLAAEGFVAARVGAGTFVVDALPASWRSEAHRPHARARVVTPFVPRVSTFGARVTQIVADMETPRSARGTGVDFRYTVASAEFPVQLWRRLMGARLRRTRAAQLGYGAAAGLSRLRRAIAAYLREARAVACDWTQVVIVNGSQQALGLIARLVLDPGDQVVIENPHYQGARQVFQAAGAQLVPVRVDTDGLDISLLPPTPAAPRLVYITPSHQFPTGGVLPLTRRLALLDWASRAGALVIEDDYDGEFRYDTRPIPSMQGLDREGRVIYVGTFSKVLVPALRLAYAVVPPSLVERFVAARWMADRQSPIVEQRVLAEFIEQGHFARHIQRARRTHALRRNALAAAVTRDLAGVAVLAGASAGLHAMLWLDWLHPRKLPDLIAAAARAGVTVSSASQYFIGEPDRAGLLIGFSHLTPRQIAGGIARLAPVVERFARETASGAEAER